MKISETYLPGLLLIEPTVHRDSRGEFYEVFQQQRYAEHKIPTFVQDNTSRSVKNTLRGLHYQLPKSQGKLVWVTHGTVWDVVVDIRTQSPTFGKWLGITLSDENHLQLYIPPGFAHGFCVVSDYADFHYKCTEYYTPHCEQGIAWNDKQLNITWPINNPILSPKDAANPSLGEMSHEKLFA